MRENTRYLSALFCSTWYLLHTFCWKRQDLILLYSCELRHWVYRACFLYSFPCWGRLAGCQLSLCELHQSVQPRWCVFELTRFLWVTSWQCLVTSKGVLFSVSQELPHQCPQWLCSFTFPLTMLFFLHILILHSLGFLMMAILSGVQWHLTVVLIGIED